MLSVIRGTTLLILESNVKVKIAKFEFVVAGLYVSFKTGVIIPQQTKKDTQRDSHGETSIPPTTSSSGV